MEIIVELTLAVATVVTMVAALGLEPEPKQDCGEGVKNEELCRELWERRGEIDPKVDLGEK